MTLTHPIELSRLEDIRNAICVLPDVSLNSVIRCEFDDIGSSYDTTVFAVFHQYGIHGLMT